MMLEKSEFSDEVYENALPELKKIFADITLKEIKGASLEYMPYDLRLQLDLAQARIDKRNNPPTLPVGKLTLSNDGKTCNECKSDLVVKTSTVSDSAGVRTKQFLGCPKSCNSLTKKMNKSKLENEDFLEKAKTSMKDAKDTYTMKTRNMTPTEASLIMKRNLNNGFRCSPPNNQFTELTYATKTTFDETHLLNKKTGKILEYVTCEHNLDNHVQAIDDCKIYNVLKIEEIGNLNEITQYNVITRCFKCSQIERNLSEIEHGWTKDYDGKERTQWVADIKEEAKNVVSFRLTVQRVDEQVPILILKVLKEKRFQNSDGGYLISAKVTELVIDQVSNLQVPDNLKAKVTSQLKALYNKNLLEMEVEEHIFSNNRYEKVHTEKVKGGVDRHFKNSDFVGNAITLNKYRVADHSAIYLTKQVLLELEQLSELRKSPNTNITFDAESRKWGFDEAMYWNELWLQIQKQVSLNPDAQIIYNPKFGQVWIACKSGIKRQRKSRR